MPFHLENQGGDEQRHTYTHIHTHTHTHTHTYTLLQQSNEASNHSVVTMHRSHQVSYLPIVMGQERTRATIMLLIMDLGLMYSTVFRLRHRHALSS